MSRREMHYIVIPHDRIDTRAAINVAFDIIFTPPS